LSTILFVILLTKKDEKHKNMAHIWPSRRKSYKLTAQVLLSRSNLICY